MGLTPSSRYLFLFVSSQTASLCICYFTAHYAFCVERANTYHSLQTFIIAFSAASVPLPCPYPSPS